MVIGGALGMLVVIWMSVYFGRSDKRLETRLVATVNGYLRSLPANDIWWLETTPVYSEESRQLFERKRIDVLSIIEKYRTVSAFASRICEHAKEMPLAAVMRGDVKKVHIFAAGNGFLITAVPRDMYDSVSQFLKGKSGGTTFQFSLDNRCVFFPAMQMSESFFASTFMHEYGHGIRAMIDKDVGTRTEEEVLMHELTFAVLSHGIPAYRQKITHIATRDKPRTFKQAIAHVTAEELHELDVLVHGLRYGKEVAKYSIMQHLHSIGFVYAERKGLPTSVKGQVYDWVSAASQ